MKKIVESKVKNQENDLKRKEELDAKLKEAEENKKRILESKKNTEYEKQKIRDQQRHPKTSASSGAKRAACAALKSSVVMHRGRDS